MVLLVLKLISAHFVARLLLQPDMHARARSGASLAGRIGAISKQSALFVVISAFLVLPGLRSTPMSLPMLVGLLVAAGVLRFLVDLISTRFAASWMGFVLGQVAHVLVLVCIVSCFHSVPGLAAFVKGVWASPRTYVLLTAYALSIGGGSILVPLVTGSLVGRSAGATPTGQEGLKDAGRYIGILERLLITTLIICWPKLDAAAVGLIFSAKSIARFPEFSKQRFAEYYLIGTLTSFIVAIVSGLIARLPFQ